jgi:hypothetical protein
MATAEDAQLALVVSDHFKPANNYRNDPATPGRISRHFSSKQARCKLLLSGLFERKMPLPLKRFYMEFTGRVISIIRGWFNFDR